MQQKRYKTVALTREIRIFKKTRLIDHLWKTHNNNRDKIQNKVRLDLLKSKKKTLEKIKF